MTQVAVARRFSPIERIVGRSVLPMMDTGRRHRRLYAKHLDGMITPSREVKRTVEGYSWMSGVKVQNIPNGLDIGRVDRAFQKWHGREAIRERLELSPDTFTIGAVGRLEKHKGFHHLIEAFGHVKERHANCALILVGRGSERAALEAQADRLGEARSSIRFLGHQSDIDPLLMALDALVLPSTTKYETFGQCLIEAMAFYVPVIGSEVGGIPEIIYDGENGLLVPPGDESSLAEAMLKLINDGELRRQLARNGRRCVEDYYLEETMIDRLENYLSNLLRTP
jgi:glycosyltransferase involved in cell wall biosynthesis